MFELPTMEVPVPTIEEVGLDDINDLLHERQNCKIVKEAIEASIKRIGEELGRKLDEKNVKTAVWENCLVIRRQGSKPRPVLDRVLLLEAGVSPQQLKAGTKFGEPGKPGITVRPISENKTKESEESI